MSKDCEAANKCRYVKQNYDLSLHKIASEISAYVWEVIKKCMSCMGGGYENPLNSCQVSVSIVWSTYMIVMFFLNNVSTSLWVNQLQAN
jgi:hypothetical protein